MDLEFENFLRKLAISDIDIQHLKDEKIDISVVNVMTDEELKWFIKEAGDRILIRDFVKRAINSARNKDCLLVSVKERLAALKSKRLEGRCKRKRKNEQGGSTSPTSSQGSATKSSRQIWMGWKHFENDQTVLVIEKKGGGTRPLSLPKEYKKSDLINLGKRLFFSEGKSSKGYANEFVFDIIDSHNKSVPPDKTILNLVEEQTNKAIRIYLKTERLQKSTMPETTHEVEIEVENSIINNNEEKSANHYLLDMSETEVENIEICYAAINTSKYTGFNAITLMKRSEIFEKMVFNNDAIDFETFDPVDHDYPIVKITLHGEVIINIDFSQTNCQQKYITFPSDDITSKRHEILYDVDKLSGNSDGQLGVGLIYACDHNCNADYEWYLDNQIFKKGKGLYWINTFKEGLYTCKVICNQKTIVPSQNNEQDTELLDTFLPIIPKSDLIISDKVFGCGSQGIVREGKWLGTPVATKTFKSGKLSSTQLTEVRILARIRHPNIISIMGISLNNRQTHVVFELIEGHNLGDILFDDEIKLKYKLNLANKRRIFLQICQAVNYLHGQTNPIIHQDIKPDNILIDFNYVVKLCDLGLAKLKNMATLYKTVVGSLKGTVMYLAPEIILQKSTASTKSDIWSLACTIVETMSEKDLWSDLDDDYINILKERFSRKEIPNIEDIHSDLQQMLKSCFDYDPVARPSALELLEHFQEHQCLSNELITS